MNATNTELLISKGDLQGVRHWAESTTSWKDAVFTEVKDSPLHFAVRCAQVAIARYFLTAGHPPSLPNAIGETPLFLACDFNLAGLCADLAKVPNADLNGALHRAAASGAEGCIQKLLELGAKVNSRDECGDTPLHVAALHAQTGACCLLLSQAAEIEAENKELERPLHKAAAARDSQTLEMLVARGAVLSPEAANRRTPMVVAIRAGNLASIEVLAKAGVLITKSHAKVAKEASRISVWRYLQTQLQRPSQALPNSRSSGEESPIFPVESPEVIQLREITEERNALREEVASLRRQLAVALLPTLIPFSDLTLGLSIGRGSYGEVFKGRWRGSEVAVKQIHTEDESDFRSEAALLQSLRHPNVVLVMGVCLSPAALVLEYVPQGSLHNLLHRSKSELTQTMVESMALDIARAMNYLHCSEPPVLHRDLNPANCLVTSDFHIKVCDFGLARVKSVEGTKSLGTVQYSAPEFISAQVFTPKSDVYSFGVLLWELVTRQVPYDGMQPVQVLYSVVHNSRRPVVRQETPLKDLMESCWSASPEERPDFPAVIARLEQPRTI